MYSEKSYMAGDTKMTGFRMEIMKIFLFNFITKKGTNGGLGSKFGALMRRKKNKPGTSKRS